MPRFSFFRFRQRDKGKGQGLVEYALILVLVSIVTIVIVTLFGKTIANSYCTITYKLNQGSPGTSACRSPIVTCMVTNPSSSSFNMEATIIDPDSATPNQVSRVEFFNGSTLYRTENSYRYCYGAGDSSCNSVSVPSGTVITATAYDADGNSGSCTATVP